MKRREGKGEQNFRSAGTSGTARRLPRVIVIIVTGPATGVTTSTVHPPMAEPSRTEYSLAMIMPHDPASSLYFVSRYSSSANLDRESLPPRPFLSLLSLSPSLYYIYVFLSHSLSVRRFSFISHFPFSAIALFRVATRMCTYIHVAYRVYACI